MPIEWDTTSGSSIQITSPDGMTTSIAGAAAHGIAPWLAYKQLNGPIHWQTPTGSGQIETANLHLLLPEEKLVGVCVDDDSLAKEIFPGYSTIPVHLDALTAPALAWQTLDAVVIPPQSLTKLRGDLYIAGVTLAVTGDNPPDQLLPWTHSGRLWIARPAAPVIPVISEQAYAPTFGWSPGRSAWYRTRIIFIGLVVAIAFSIFALWRSRWMPVGMIAFAAITIVALSIWNRSQSPITIMPGDIFLTGISSEIHDRWIFQTATRDVDWQLPVGGLFTPVFYNPKLAGQSNLTLDCSANGEPTKISSHLNGQGTIAIVSREISVKSEMKPENPIHTPLRLLAAQSIYPGFKIAGESAKKDPNQWPALILERK